MPLPTPSMSPTSSPVLTQVLEPRELVQTNIQPYLERQCMDYYQCSIEALHGELQRRAYSTYGSHDQLSERLRLDDDERGSEATTVMTASFTASVPHEASLIRTGDFGQTFPVHELVNQNIIYWNLNTFFPALQLFFESGFSCTIEGDHLPGAIVGLDAKLRFRLTDCTYEEQGRFTKGILLEKSPVLSASIKIVEAAIAQRTSTGVKPMFSTNQSLTSKAYGLDIVQEVHTVIGLRLSGMNEMGYVWAKTEMPFRTAEGRIWSDVRLAGLRNDVPACFLGLAADFPEAVRDVTVVEKGSVIKPPSTIPGGMNNLEQPWI